MATRDRTPVITNRFSMVHDLTTTGRCAQMRKLRGEFSRGTQRYTEVKGVQVITYGLPGCTDCFDSQTVFDHYFMLH
jgi:hypothetical protein